jgi:hypothetical protein
MNPNVLKVSQDEIKRVMKMPVKILLRNSLKLLKTYPSKNRDLMKKDIVLDYKDGAKLTDKEEIDKAIELARKGLVHLMGYDLIMKELLSDNTGAMHIDAGTPQPVDAKQKKKMEEMLKQAEEKQKEKYEYF